MTTKQNKKSSHVGEIVGVTAGIAVAAASAAYFLYGSKNAKKYRSAIKSWMFKAKAEILERLEKLEVVSEDEYNTIVEKVLAKYHSIDPQDMKKFMTDIKSQWKAIKKHISPKKAVKKAKKVAAK